MRSQKFMYRSRPSQKPTYHVRFGRRREGKTDYRKRRKMILSRLPRLVLRVTNRHVIVQFVEAKVEGDHTLVSAHSENLEEYGWRGSRSNTPAVYLTSLLASLKARKKGLKKAILDVGLSGPTKGSKLFASLKAATDAGLDVPHDAKVVPSDDRIGGLHIAEYSRLLATDPSSYQRQFSMYLKRELRPEDLPQHFSRVKERIIGALK